MLDTGHWKQPAFSKQFQQSVMANDIYQHIKLTQDIELYGYYYTVRSMISGNLINFKIKQE